MQHCISSHHLLRFPLGWGEEVGGLYYSLYVLNNLSALDSNISRQKEGD